MQLALPVAACSLHGEGEGLGVDDLLDVYGRHFDGCVGVRD